MKRIPQRLAVIGLTAGLAVPAGFALADAGASSDRAASSTTSAQVTGQQGNPTNARPSRAERRRARQEALAKELGISVDTLIQAERSAITKRVEEKLANGKLTQAEADRLVAAIGTGNFRNVAREIRAAHRAARGAATTVAPTTTTP
jgi:DNA-binding XRE family transcriptional regulator